MQYLIALVLFKILICVHGRQFFSGLGPYETVELFSF